MSATYQVFRIICAFLLFSVALCSNRTYYGRLTANCARHYYRTFVSKTVPARTYRYFHETLTSPTDSVVQVNNATRQQSTVARQMTVPGKDDTHVDIRFRIIGGTQVPITEVPYQVLYGLYCGGTLIAPDWVLTAAHCKDKENYIYAGSTERSLATGYPICAHFIHPQWSISNLHTHDYDYQLVLLETSVPITPSSMPIAIGNLEDIRPGVMVAVSGWGHTKYKQQAMQDMVRRVYVPIMSSELCRSLPLTNYKTITPRMFCAGLLNGTKDSCQGDSGGPAVANGKLLGVVSFGVACAMPEQPGVYTNVPLARGWIRKVTGLPL